MVINQVLDTALRGTSTWRKELFKSAHGFEKKRLQGVSNHPFANLAFHEPVHVGSLVNTLGSLTTVSECLEDRNTEYTSMNLALAISFGNWLIDSAHDCLPTNFEVPRDYSDWEFSELPPCLMNTLVARWRGAKSIEGKREALQLFAQTLAPKRDANGELFQITWQEDKNNQGMERVLPHHFGKWDCSLGTDNIANCLGKFLMTLAFGKLLGARMLAVSPVQSRANEVLFKRQKVADQAQRCLRELDIKISDSRLESLKSISQRGEEQRSHIFNQHFAVVFQVSQDEWILLDPNDGISSYVGSEYDLERCSTLLKDLRQVAPGVQLLRDSGESISLSLPSYRTLKGTLEKELPNLKQARNWQELLQAFSSSDLLMAFKSNERIKPSLHEGLPLLVQAGNILVHLTKPLWVLENGGVISKDLMSETVLSELGNLLENVPFERSPDAIQSIAYRYLRISEDMLLAEQEFQRVRGRLRHPSLQIGSPDLAAGVSTLSHLAYASSKMLGDQLEANLFTSCFDIFRLTNTAVTLLDPEVDDSVHASRACSILEKLSTTSSNAELILERLSSFDLTTSSLDCEGVRA